MTSASAGIDKVVDIKSVRSATELLTLGRKLNGTYVIRILNTSNNSVVYESNQFNTKPVLSASEQTSTIQAIDGNTIHLFDFSNGTHEYSTMTLAESLNKVVPIK